MQLVEDSWSMAVELTGSTMKIDEREPVLRPWRRATMVND